MEDGSEDGIYLIPGKKYWTFNLLDVEEIGIARDHDVAAAENLITPAASDDGRELDNEIVEQSNFFDEDYSDQESIFGTSNIEYLTNSFNSVLQEARHEAFNISAESTIANDDGRAFNLVQSLNLELPSSGELLPNRVYTIPPGWRSSRTLCRSRIVSASWSDRLHEHGEPSQGSAWNRGFHRFRHFVRRLSEPFRFSK